MNIGKHLDKITNSITDAEIAPITNRRSNERSIRPYSHDDSYDGESYDDSYCHW